MPEHSGFSLQRVTGRAMMRLRLRPGGVQAATTALQLPPALQCSGSDPSVAWLSPEQWLFCSDSKTADTLATEIGSVLQDQLHVATDISSGLACFSLEGTTARNLLAMGCAIDMHPDSFRAGRCVRTLFANIALVIVAIDAQRFELYADRSLARYLENWISAAGEDPLTGNTEMLS